MMETQATTYCCLEPFRWESLWRWDLGHNLLWSQAFLWESLWRWDLGFHWAFFTNSSFFHNRILAIRKPLTRIFSFSMGSHLSRSPFHEFSFTMEFRLSRSPFHELFSFSRWGSGYKGAFHTNFFFFNGISSITKPFSRIFFHNGISAITKPFSRTFFFFTMGFWL
jgi:hypothetical protein